jgi:hypothetical protein
MNPASHVSWDAWGPFKEWFISRSSIKGEKRASERGMNERPSERLSENCSKNEKVFLLNTAFFFKGYIYTNLHSKSKL